jgi:hypothetical protein
MKLLAMITVGKSIERYLAKLGEPTDMPGRSPSRGPRWDEVALNGTMSWIAYFVVARSVLLFNDLDTRQALQLRIDFRTRVACWS